MKILVLAAICLIAAGWLMRAGKGARHAGGAGKGGAADAAESMVACAECGVHVPASEALAGTRGRRYCSDEHRRRHAA